MNFTNSGPGWQFWKAALIKSIRIFTARQLIKLGNRCADLALWIAPEIGGDSL